MKLPQAIIYNKQHKVESFDLERFRKSLLKYGPINEEVFDNELEKFSNYNPLHYSCLVEIGVKSLENDEDAQKYLEEHRTNSKDEVGFERLRRITGYLVGSLERWNDGKKAEEHDRVKHNVNGVYTVEEKIEREELKRNEEKLYGTI